VAAHLRNARRHHEHSAVAMLYAGLVKKKWALNSAVMVFYAFAAVLVTWVLFGYNLSFGQPWNAWQFIGIPGPALSPAAELGQATIPLAAPSMPALRFSGATMVYFQFVFAAIAPILVAGSVLGRMNFKAWMLFVPLWSTLVYSIGCFSLWGGGWLTSLGAIDYSGGYVIHWRRASPVSLRPRWWVRASPATSAISRPTT